MGDIKYAIRALARSPGFTAVAMLTLTLGIGISTAIFSVVHAVLLRPVPFHDPDRLIMVWETDRASRTTHEPSSLPDFLDFRERSRQVSAFAAFIAGEANFAPDLGEPSRVPILRVSDGYFSLLGITAVAGRTFIPAEERTDGPPVVLISEGFWTRAFARDPGVIGRQLRLDDRPRTIVGVLPATADFGILQVLRAADYGRGYADRDVHTGVDVFLPMRGDPKQLPRETHPLLVLGRLAPAASVTTAQEELAAITLDLERSYPVNEARGAFIEPLRTVIVGPVEPALLVLLGAVGVVLLIACVNVTHLLLARGTVRAREIAVRRALGAAESRLLKQFAVESAVLTTAAAGAGILLAIGVLNLLVLRAPADIPGLAAVAVDRRVLGVMAAACGVITVVFSLIPVLQARSGDVLSNLKAEPSRTGSGGRESSLARSALVVGEVALAAMLAIGAGLLIKSFSNLMNVNPGFDTRGVAKAEFQLPSGRYQTASDKFPNLPAVHRFHAAALERVTALPGVESAAIAAYHPLEAGFTNSFQVVGREAESKDWPEISVRVVTPGYFRTAGVPLVRGRLIGVGDGTFDAPVVLINEESTRRFFADRDPIGHEIQLYGSARRIAGVVGNERIHGLDDPAPIAVYLPMAQAPFSSGALMARTTGDARALGASLRAVIREIDPALAVFGVQTLDETVSRSVAERRFTMLLMTGFGGLALALAVIGIHGVLSYTVAQRTRELGIRMALGAEPATIVRSVLGHSARLTIAGLAMGLGLSLGFNRWIAGLLFGVGSWDPGIVASVIAVLGAVALLAAMVPALRAMSVDPIGALRCE